MFNSASVLNGRVTPRPDFKQIRQLAFKFKLAHGTRVGRMYFKYLATGSERSCWTSGVMSFCSTLCFTRFEKVSQLNGRKWDWKRVCTHAGNTDQRFIIATIFTKWDEAAHLWSMLHFKNVEVHVFAQSGTLLIREDENRERTQNIGNISGIHILVFLYKT